MTEHKQVAKVFKALSDEKRLVVLEQLRQGEKNAGTLINELGIAQSALSYHMKILCESGIVENRHEGKWTFYRLSPQGIQRAEKILQEVTKIKELV